MLKGDLTNAIASFDRSLELDPSLREARLNRGIGLLRQGHFSRAADDLQKIAAAGQSPLRGDAAYHLAIALDRLGRAADAENWLEKARTWAPELEAALLYQGLLRERRGDLQGAGRAYLDYLKTHPQSTVALLRFGIAAQRAGRADVARSYLLRVTELAPQSAEAIEARKFLVMWE